MTDKRTCKHCYWWAKFDKSKFLGICGHRDSQNRCTDKTETCEKFEQKGEDE